MKQILGEPVGNATEYLLSTEDHTLIYEWCCDCGLKHTVIYDPVKVKGKLFLKKRLWRDDLATKLRRHYERSKAKRQTRRQKK